MEKLVKPYGKILQLTLVNRVVATSESSIERDVSSS